MHIGKIQKRQDRKKERIKEGRKEQEATETFSGLKRCEKKT